MARGSRFRPTPVGASAHQAAWAEAMKEAMRRSGLNQKELAAQVAGPLGLPDGSERVRNWLANRSVVDPHAIPVLARAVGAHPLEMLRAFGLVEDSVAGLATRLEATRRDLRRLASLLQGQHRTTGGAAFAEVALRDGGWAVTVVPHWRGRLCRYHFADYVVLDRLGATGSRRDAERVFADAFARTGASWDDAPFATERATAWTHGHSRLYVPRLTAPCPPRKDAAALDLTGVVVAGQRWTGVYTVAALVSTALGWGRDSFATLARSVAPDGLLDETLADEILRDWLRAPTTAPTRVWAYVITSGPAPTAAPARLLARTGPDVHVVLLTPDADMVATLASLSGADRESVGREAEGWRRLLPRHERLTHVPVAAPTGRGSVVVTPGDRAFVDAYFDTSVEAALTVLDTLAGPGRARRRIVPAAVAARDPFAALAARRQRSRATSVSSSSSRASSSPVSRSASPG